MRITSKGQVTIPQAVREQAGFLPGTEIAFVYENGRVTLEKSESAGVRPSRGAKLVDRLWGQGRSGMTTDELMALMRGPSADEELGSE